MSQQKYRAWDGGKMVYDADPSMYPLEQVMAATGDIDQTGKEVYTGDIVDFEADADDGGVICARGLMAWSPEDSFHVSIPDPFPRGKSDFGSIRLTVIGNVFENDDIPYDAFPSRSGK